MPNHNTCGFCLSQVSFGGFHFSSVFLDSRNKGTFFGSFVKRTCNKFELRTFPTRAGDTNECIQKSLVHVDAAAQQQPPPLCLVWFLKNFPYIVKDESTE